MGAALVLGSGVALAATVRCNSSEEVCKGTNKDDTLLGTKKANDMSGLRGNDTLRGLGGSDNLDGGAGDDTLEGGDGFDNYFFDRNNWGHDTATDTVASSGFFDNSVMFTSKVTEDLIINLNSGPAPEVQNQSGTGTINWDGDVIKDVFDGAGDDTITGDDTGNYILANRGGADTIFTGDGDDQIFAGDGSGGDTVDCGPGKDTVTADPGDTVLPNCELATPRNGTLGGS
jgi:Ca2+-binding RTX toxin-like protein